MGIGSRNSNSIRMVRTSTTAAAPHSTMPALQRTPIGEVTEKLLRLVYPVPAGCYPGMFSQLADQLEKNAPVTLCKTGRERRLVIPLEYDTKNYELVISRREDIPKKASVYDESIRIQLTIPHVDDYTSEILKSPSFYGRISPDDRLFQTKEGKPVKYAAPHSGGFVMTTNPGVKLYIRLVGFFRKNLG